MFHDLWFTRHEGQLWFIWCEPGEEPMNFPRRAANVREACKWLKKAGIRIGQVGIADSGMLGLE